MSQRPPSASRVTDASSPVIYVFADSTESIFLPFRIGDGCNQISNRDPVVSFGERQWRERSRVRREAFAKGFAQIAALRCCTSACVVCSVSVYDCESSLQRKDLNGCAAPFHTSVNPSEHSSVRGVML